MIIIFIYFFMTKEKKMFQIFQNSKYRKKDTSHKPLRRLKNGWYANLYFSKQRNIKCQIICQIRMQNIFKHHALFT